YEILCQWYFLILSCVHCEELTQPPSMTVQPGQPLTISCKVLYSVASDHTAWIRQPAGKTLEWIGIIYSGGSTRYTDSLKNKFSITRDTSSNTFMVYLKLTGLRAEDIAVHYCAEVSGGALQKPFRKSTEGSRGSCSHASMSRSFLSLCFIVVDEMKTSSRLYIYVFSQICFNQSGLGYVPLKYLAFQTYIW
uniref:Immunoglobulin V-set domain-containing protein n=1 Tax=Esox lucius TaxID=8010 RepID=A0A6Q2WUD0_ESOLU